MDGQMSFNTDPESIRSITQDVAEAIGAAKQSIDNSSAHVKTRHEGYGIVAQIMNSLDGAVKSAKKDRDQYLTILPTSDKSAIEAASALQQSAAAIAVIAAGLSAWSQKISEDLFYEESEEPTPIEQWLNSKADEEADSSDGQGADQSCHDDFVPQDEDDGAADAGDVIGADE